MAVPLCVHHLFFWPYPPCPSLREADTARAQAAVRRCCACLRLHRGEPRVGGWGVCRSTLPLPRAVSLPDRGSPMPRPLRGRSQAGRARREGGWRPPSTFPSAATTTSPPDKSPRKQPHPLQPTSTPLSVANREPVTYGFLHAETLRGATGVPPREGRRHSPAVHTPPLSVSRMAAGGLPHGGEAHLHPGPVVSVWVRQPAEGGDSRPTPTPHLAGAPRRGSTTNTRVCVCAKPRPPPFPLRRVVEHLLRVWSRSVVLAPAPHTRRRSPCPRCTTLLVSAQGRCRAVGGHRSPTPC